MNYKKTNLTDFKKIGYKIKQIRIEETNLTQQQLAEKSGLAIKTISDIELGKTKDMLITNLDSICKALNTRIENIIY